MTVAQWNSQFYTNLPHKWLANIRNYFNKYMFQKIPKAKPLIIT